MDGEILLQAGQLLDKYPQEGLLLCLIIAIVFLWRAYKKKDTELQVLLKEAWIAKAEGHTMRFHETEQTLTKYSRRKKTVPVDEDRRRSPLRKIRPCF